MEEIQNAIISGYVLFFFIVSSPDAPVTKVLPYMPFWAPMWMLMRLAVGTVA